MKKTIIGGVLGAILITGCVLIAKASSDFDNIVKVINKSTSQKNFEISDRIDTEALLGNQSGAINTEVNGYKAYNDKYVLFYVENPHLKGMDSKTFTVNFKTNYKTCHSIFMHMDIGKFNLKDITINGESVKALKEYTSGMRKNMTCAKNHDYSKNSVYNVKYEFYFDK